MDTVDIVLVRKQVLEKLGAMPRFARYADQIGENADYAVKDEITDAALIVDAVICEVDIIGTAGHPARSNFMIPSGNLLHGDFIPAHTGEHGDVKVSLGGIFDFSAPVKSRDEILQMRKMPSLYGGPSRNHFIEDNVCYHAGEFAKVWYPSFTKTDECQAPSAYTDIVVYGTIQFLEKLDSDDNYFKKFNELFLAGRRLIREKHMTIPPQEQLEQALRKAA